jgi:hypothetical protein
MSRVGKLDLAFRPLSPVRFINPLTGVGRQLSRHPLKLLQVEQRRVIIGSQARLIGQNTGQRRGYRRIIFHHILSHGQGLGFVRQLLNRLKPLLVIFDQPDVR